jgi:mannosyltransferase OCH1-like enzyme
MLNTHLFAQSAILLAALIENCLMRNTQIEIINVLILYKYTGIYSSLSFIEMDLHIKTEMS